MATFDWSIEQPNVVNIAEPDMTLLTFSDDVDSEYIVRYVNPKGLIQQRLISTAAAAERAPVQLDLSPETGYTMTIELDKQPRVVLDDNLTLSDHAIWSGAHGIASKLAASDSKGFTLWPGNHTIQSQQLLVDATACGTLKVGVKLSNGQSTFIHAMYPELSDISAASSSNRQLTDAQMEFQKKFRRGDPRVSAMLPNIHALCGKDVCGNDVKFIWHVRNDNQAQLVDIEYPVHSLEKQNELQSIKFACDPMDLDHVTGLVMALEDKIASGDLNGPVIEQALDTIDTHRKALEADEVTTASPKVNAAVKEATDALWQTIDGRARQRRYYDKMIRGGGEMAVELAENLRTRMEKARQYGMDKKGPKKWISSSRKSTIRNEIEDLENAIMRMRSTPGLTAAETSFYNKALEELRLALKPNSTSI